RLLVARNYVELEQELRDVEGMDHVGTVQRQVNGLAGRDDHRAGQRDRLAVATSDQGLPIRAEVLEAPVEPPCDRHHVDLWVGRGGLDGVERLPGDDEQVG